MSTITISNANSNWPELYHNEKNRIVEMPKTWINCIEHIGSTAVPNLPAKPTIDICIGVADLKIADEFVVPAIQKLQYDYLPHLEQSIPERRYLQKLNAQGEHLFHIHIVVYKDRLWNEYINFRDYLIAHPQAAEKYATLKKSLQKRFAHDRVAYTEGKADFIQAILKQL